MGLKPIAIKGLVGTKRFHKEIDRTSIFCTERVVSTKESKKCMKFQEKIHLSNENKFTSSISTEST
jgi:hypothetical protein